MPVSSSFDHDAPHVHILTPGDHFSPRTGSAVPTVVHGLAGAGGAPSSVAVERGTYAEHYPSASVVEYAPAPPVRPAERYLDAGMARLGLPRRAARRWWGAALHDQGSWDPSVIMAHNGPQLVPLVDTRRHESVLYAHNEVLRSYGPGEAKRTLGGAARIICVSEFLASRTRPHLEIGRAHV